MLFFECMFVRAYLVVKGNDECMDFQQSRGASSVRKKLFISVFLKYQNQQVYIQNFGILAQDRSFFHNPADIFGESLDALVEEERSIFPIQKDEVIKVEELYRCCDLNDDVLDLNASNQRMHYNFGEFLTLEYHPTKTDHDIPDSSPNLSDDAGNFFDGILGPAEAIFPYEKSNLSNSCGDYPVRECFNVTDKQWLKNRLCLNSQDLYPLNDDDQSDKNMPTLNQCSILGGTIFSNVFNFKKKPRLKRVKRKWQAYNYVPWKEFSSPEIEEDNVNAALKRFRKPPQLYIKEFTKKKICGASTIRSKKQHQGKRCEAKRFMCSDKTFNGECIQVPFGEPLLSETAKKKAHQLKESKGTGLLTLDPESTGDSVSVESQEDIPEDDYNKKKTDNTGKKHIFWSISEVMNLVEGVSILGVGRWNHIKKLMFNSSPNRTSVDLKDKWRNLLRASCAQLKNGKREVLPRNHTSVQIPLHILRRVKELADIRPLPQLTQPRLIICNFSTTSSFGT